jgi:hypothetical protein
MSTRARERFTFETPGHLWDAAKTICVELEREYPYLAHFHLENDGRYTLFGLNTISRSISPHYGEMIGNTGWDVDWIERDQMYAFHQSSGGGSLRHTVSGIYWRHPAMIHAVREETASYCNRDFRRRNRTRRIRRIPVELKGRFQYGTDVLARESDDLMRFLDNGGVDTEVYYCAVCEEYLMDRMGDLCEHVWWCDDDSVLRGPGSTDYPEPCDSEDCYQCSRERSAVT